MNNMHDWTLQKILYEWKTARVTLIFENLLALEAYLVAENVVDVHIPQRREWGPSVSVNKLEGPVDFANGLRQLTIEMQSGDDITILAGGFLLPVDRAS